MNSAARIAQRQLRPFSAILRGVGPRTIGGSPHAVRYMSANVSPKGQESCGRANVDFVRDAIHKMLAKDDVEVKPISNEALEQSLASFANLYQEARACINDCKEVRAGSLEFYEEAFTAQKAVDNVFNSYIDLLDDIRRATDDQLKELCQDRLALANSVKCLRQEVHEMLKPKQAAA